MDVLCTRGVWVRLTEAIGYRNINELVLDKLIRAASHLDPHVTHCGIFDDQGAVLFYGLLDGDGQRKPNGPIVFDRHKISLEWS